MYIKFDLIIIMSPSEIQVCSYVAYLKNYLQTQSKEPVRETIRK